MRLADQTHDFIPWPLCLRISFVFCSSTLHRLSVCVSLLTHCCACGMHRICQMALLHQPLHVGDLLRDRCGRQAQLQSQELNQSRFLFLSLSILVLLSPSCLSPMFLSALVRWPCSDSATDSPPTGIRQKSAMQWSGVWSWLACEPGGESVMATRMPRMNSRDMTENMFSAKVYSFWLLILYKILYATAR